MKAVWYETVGPAGAVLQYGERPDPAVGVGEVLIRVHASGVNPSDVKARGGARGGKSQLEYPAVIPHSDGAGVVLAVGAGAEKFAVGDRVWFCNAQWKRANGSAAERIAIDERLVFPLPEGVSFETGAALGIPALTACHAVTGFGDVADKVVFVSGGGGTVGRLAVQFAKRAGAFVVATGRGEQQKARILAAGADAYVDFTSSTLVADVCEATLGRKLDHIVEVEFGANVAALAELVAERGVIAAYGSAVNPKPELPFYLLLFKGIRLEFVLVYLLTHKERADAAERVNLLVGQEQLDVPVYATFPLRDCAQAHELVESGKRAGPVIVTTE